MIRQRLAPVIAAGLAIGTGGCADPLSPVPLEAWTRVVTGGDHSCALTVNGEAYCWGRGGNAETGLGHTQDTNRPRPVDGGLRFVELTAGLRHTCGLAPDGSAHCWGWNVAGQLGVASEVGGLLRPNPVVTEHRFTLLSAGWYHTCGITTEGAALCWGANGDGQLGTGTASNALAPEPVAFAGTFREITAGGFHTCGVVGSGPANGQVHCWGRNTEGQLGAGDTQARSTPAAVAGAAGYLSVSAGRGHTCAITAGREIHCWGGNARGQLGIRGFGAPGLPGSTVPARAVRDESFATVTAGLDFTCATDTADQVFCWGAGREGQLGMAIVEDVPRPSHLARRTFSFVAASEGTHACAVSPDRRLYCWGSGDAGQLGHPDITFTTVPLEVPRVR